MLIDREVINQPSQPPQSNTSTNTNTKPDNKLPRTVRNQLLRLSHYQFRQRLFAKALCDPNKVKDVILTTEEFTTKQCPKCPHLHFTIGGSETYYCRSCHFRGGRDHTGSFNILVRSLTKGEIEFV